MNDSLQTYLCMTIRVASMLNDVIEYDVKFKIFQGKNRLQEQLVAKQVETDVFVYRQVA